MSITPSFECTSNKCQRTGAPRANWSVSRRLKRYNCSRLNQKLPPHRAYLLPIIRAAMAMLRILATTLRPFRTQTTVSMLTGTHTVTWLPLEKQKRCAPKQSMQCLLLACNGQCGCSSQALLSTCMCSTVSGGPERCLALHCEPTKKRPYWEGEFCFLSACGATPSRFLSYVSSCNRGSTRKWSYGWGRLVLC